MKVSAYFIIAIMLCAILFLLSLFTIAIYPRIVKKMEAAQPERIKRSKIALICVFAIVLILSCTMLVVAVLLPMQAEKERQAYIEMYSAIYETQILDEKATEINFWLANARADKKTYGRFSKYYTVNLDNLQYVGYYILPKPTHTLKKE